MNVRRFCQAGGRICVGDQLHPSGALDPAVYRLIGKSFGKIEALEPWLYGAQPMAEAALAYDQCKAGVTNGIGSLNRDVEGAAQMLLEAGIQFDIADESVNLDKYTVRSLFLMVPSCLQHGTKNCQHIWLRAESWL
jgi:hypothetical protein